MRICISIPSRAAVFVISRGPRWEGIVQHLCHVDDCGLTKEHDTPRL
jgi:hypothetical protein